MKITLYRYIGDSDTANKLLKQCTVIYDKEVIPYGAFNPNGASFRLDTLHDVNYGKFTYNSHDYYGYVDVSTDSKGIYNYSITTDPLTTAWYAGCFNVGNICKYSDYGTGKFFDDRATYSPDLNYEYIQIKPTTTTFRIIVVIARSYQTDLADSDSVVGSRPVYGKIYNPMYDVYNMDYTDYARFAASSSNAIYNNYRGCIFRIFAVPSDEISAVNLTNGYKKVKKVQLYSSAADRKPVLPCPSDQEAAAVKDLDNTYKMDTPAEGLTYNENWLTKFTVAINKPINSWRRLTMIKLYVEDMGYISFKYSDVAKGANITSIGYRKSYDYISGLQRATLIVNNNVLKDYFIQGNIANSIPYFDADHQKSFNERLAGSLSAGIGAASGIMSFAGSGALSAAAGSAGSLKYLWKILGPEFSKWSDINTVFAQTETDDMRAKFSEARRGAGRLRQEGGSPGRQLGIQNIISSINQMSNSSNGVGFTLNGGGTGSIDLPNRQGSFIIWQESPPHNLADIEGKFGKPDGLVRVVGNLTGWVQTEACHLPSNGLPFDIIDAAEGLADKGFRIVS